MKKFTKMFMTLAFGCMAGNVSAQDWQTIESAGGWVHEWNQDQTAQLDEARQPDANGVYKVWCRSEEQAMEAGNPTMTGGENSTFADWDSQFFITWDKESALQDGDQLRVTMSIKADVAQSGIATQAHGAPGAYQHYACIGTYDFTDEWVEYAPEVTVSGAMVGMYTIAFNLAKGGENNYYFKDIKVEVIKAKPIDSWTDIIAAAGEDKCVYAKEYPAAEGTLAVEDNGVVTVVSAPKEKEDWDSQFWIRFPQNLPNGTKYKISFECKASSAQTGIGTQWHAEPGAYNHWTGVGSVDFTEEWNTISREGSIDADGKVSHSLAFNLTKADEVTYYFRNIHFEIPSDQVTEFDFPEVEPGPGPEPEPIVKPDIPEGYIELTSDVFQKWSDEGPDAVPSNEVVYVDWNLDKKQEAGNTLAGTSTVDSKIYANLTPYSEIVLVCDAAEGDASATRADLSGIQYRLLFNREYQEDGQGPLQEINLTPDENGYAGFNLSKLDKEYAHLNAIKMGWGSAPAITYYILVSETTVGIENVNAAKFDNTMFDLQGRRVTKPGKGLYIMDGKKVLRY